MSVTLCNCFEWSNAYTLIVAAVYIRRCKPGKTTEETRVKKCMLKKRDIVSQNHTNVNDSFATLKKYLNILFHFLWGTHLQTYNCTPC